MYRVSARLYAVIRRVYAVRLNRLGIRRGYTPVCFAEHWRHFVAYVGGVFFWRFQPAGRTWGGESDVGYTPGIRRYYAQVYAGPKPPLHKKHPQRPTENTPKSHVFHDWVVYRVSAGLYAVIRRVYAMLSNRLRIRPGYTPLYAGYTPRSQNT